MDFADSIGMIKKGIADLITLRRDSQQSKLEFLARFEKSAAWEGNDWTYWDFLSAPEELANLTAQSLSYGTIKKRCRDWMSKNEASKPPLIREIERGSHQGMTGRIRALVDSGEDPNSASLLKDTALETARHHGYDDVFDLLIELGADGDKAGFSKLHAAARYGTAKDVAPLVATFDPLWSHVCAPSVLCEAVFAGKADTVVLLLAHIASANRLDDDEVSTCFSIAAGTGDPALVRPFVQHGLQCDIGLDATLETYDVNMLKLLLEQGADVHQISDISPYTNTPEKILDKAGTPALRAYIAALLEAGWCVDDLDEFEREQIRYVTEAYLIAPQEVTASGFLDTATRCAGKANPEERTLPYYLEMLRTGESSFAARQRMPGLPNAVWTADRFGQSTTRLADGRWVQIGGEHEDSYDSDFVIFSDVVVHTPYQGARVYFYPASIFPPTDFHTASLIGEHIWIIGGLGYHGDRQPDKTLVHRLDLVDFSIHRVETTGKMPSWISGHSAVEAEGVITLSGGDIYCHSLSKNSGVFTFNTLSSE